MSVVSGQVPANTPTKPTMTDEQRAFREMLGLDDEGDKAAIGVPKGYKIDRNRNIVASPGQPGIQQDFTFKYFDGDQYAPGAGDPTQVLKLQLRLKEAGLLNKKYVPGQWDQVSADAYEMAMGYANRAGRNVDEIIDSYKQSVQDDDQKEGVVLTVKNPEDIKNVLQASAGKVIGRSLSEAEVATMVAGYQNLDRVAQEQVAAARELAATGAQPKPIIEAPSVESYAQQQIRQAHKGEADWVTANSRMQDFYSILGEGGGSVG